MSQFTIIVHPTEYISTYGVLCIRCHGLASLKTIDRKLEVLDFYLPNRIISELYVIPTHPDHNIQFFDTVDEANDAMETHHDLIAATGRGEILEVISEEEFMVIEAMCR